MHRYLLILVQHNESSPRHFEQFEHTAKAALLFRVDVYRCISAFYNL
jgi:hypothetical protein